MKSGMLVTLYIGAASAEATPEQRARIKTEVLGVLRDQEIGAKEAMVSAVLKTSEIMGPDWKPKAEWMVYIEEFLK